MSAPVLLIKKKLKNNLRKKKLKNNSIVRPNINPGTAREPLRIKPSPLTGRCAFFPS